MESGSHLPVCLGDATRHASGVQGPATKASCAGVTGSLTCDVNGDCQPETRIGIYVIDQGNFAKEPMMTTTVRLEDL
jgi:hypothetical protein